MLIDKFLRIHDYLRISITDKCNLRCSYCTPFDFPQGHYSHATRMFPEEIFEIAKVFVSLGVKKIRLTGGEPLVRKEAKNIMLLLSKLPVELTLSTNGILIDEFIDVAKEAGIKSVNVSLDSLNPGTFFNITKRTEHGKILSNIHLLLLNNFKVKINVVMMKGINENEIISFVRWTKEFPLHIRFIEYMPFLGNGWHKDKVFSYREIMRMVGSGFKFEKLEDKFGSTTKTFCVPGFKGTFGVISTMSDSFCGECNRIRLTSDGRLKNCLFSKTEADILTPFRKGEDIILLIRECILNKKFEHGGQSDLPANTKKAYNRSMIAIGG